MGADHPDVMRNVIYPGGPVGIKAISTRRIAVSRGDARENVFKPRRARIDGRRTVLRSWKVELLRGDTASAEATASDHGRMYEQFFRPGSAIVRRPSASSSPSLRMARGTTLARSRAARRPRGLTPSVGGRNPRIQFDAASSCASTRHGANPSWHSDTAGPRPRNSASAVPRDHAAHGYHDGFDRGSAGHQFAGSTGSPSHPPRPMSTEPAHRRADPRGGYRRRGEGGRVVRRPLSRAPRHRGA